MKNSDNMMERFIEMERLERSKDSHDWLLWQTIKEIFAKRDSKSYWRFPLYTKIEDTFEQPDILIIDREEGILMLHVHTGEVNAATLHQEKKRAQIQLENLMEVFNRGDPRTENKIHGKSFVVVPHIAQHDMDDAHFIFGNKLTPNRLWQTMKDAEYQIKGARFNDERFLLVQSLLHGIRLREREQRPTKTGTRYEVVYELSKQAKEVDLKQNELGKIIPPGQQRIRGIAGTGKTVVQCQKAAHMHLKYPDWQIGFVYFSSHLQETIIDQIDHWLRYFSNDAVSYETAKSHIQVKSFFGDDGFFATICEAHSYEPPTQQLLKKQQHITSDSDLVGALCTDFLSNVYIFTQLYDALLIDEGECFVSDEQYRYKDKQAFYWLAYQLVQPIENEKVNRRLIWAYDESTDLTKMLTPTARDLFGEEPSFRHFVTGMHKGGLLKSDIMHRCYRTPGPIIVAAHTIGMGLLRKEGMLAGITTKDAWQHLGYEVRMGVFQEGEQIVLYRPPEHSPNSVPKLWDGDLVTLETHASRTQELDDLAKRLQQNIYEDELDCTRHIAVLVFGEDEKLLEEVATGLAERGVPTHIPDDKTFSVPGAVTVSTVERARGHEAYMLYVVGIDKLAKDERNQLLRNELFIALLRTKAWCHLSGIEGGSFYDELHDVMKCGNTVTFIFKKSSE